MDDADRAFAVAALQARLVRVVGDPRRPVGEPHDGAAEHLGVGIPQRQVGPGNLQAGSLEAPAQPVE